MRLFMCCLGVGMSGAMASRSITLHSDGRFERDGFGSASFSSQTGAAGTFAAAGRARSGRYRIDGYRLGLTHDDGRSDSALFYGPAVRTIATACCLSTESSSSAACRGDMVLRRGP
jgi:hypothetical protein